MDGVGELLQGVVQTPAGHPAVVQLVVGPEPFQFGENGVRLATATLAVEVQARGEALDDLSDAVADNLELELEGREMLLVLVRHPKDSLLLGAVAEDGR